MPHKTNGDERKTNIQAEKASGNCKNEMLTLQLLTFLLKGCHNSASCCHQLECHWNVLSQDVPVWVIIIRLLGHIFVPPISSLDQEKVLTTGS